MKKRGRGTARKGENYHGLGGIFTRIDANCRPCVSFLLRRKLDSVPKFETFALPTELPPEGDLDSNQGPKVPKGGLKLASPK